MSQMTAEDNYEIKYRVVDQRSDSLINVENLHDNTFFVMPAQRLACDEELLNRFSSQDACMIGFIAAAAKRRWKIAS